MYSNLWIAVLMVWVIGVSTLSWESRKPTWLFFSLVVIGANLYEKSDQEVLHPEISAQPSNISS
jgi:hypothetical protein